MESNLPLPALLDISRSLSTLQLESPSTIITSSRSYASVTTSSSLLRDFIPSPPQESIIKPEPRRTAVIFQESCNKHLYIRSNDLDQIVERPERIRAVCVGIATAWNRLENENIKIGKSRWNQRDESASVGELDGLFNKMALESSGGKGKGKEVIGGANFDILFSNSILPIDNPALLYIHGEPNMIPQSTNPPPPTTLSRSTSKSTTYPNQLKQWCKASTSAIQTEPNYSEVPNHLSQNDLYLSEGSENAIFGALGAVCDGVDKVCNGEYENVFVAIRPPGHHCSGSDPSGFCWVNNVMVGAAHAHKNHDISRIIILDIDLHHGNGTQEIAWNINIAAESDRLEREYSTQSPKKKLVRKPPLSVCYTSLHDIESFPCEMGDTALVQAASLQISGGHSQFITNVHLEPTSSEEQFYKDLYPKYSDKIFGAARDYIKKTNIDGNDLVKESKRTLIFISAGFDASEHEGIGMSRHRKSVPTSFFERIAKDAKEFANEFAGGKIVAVLEGGYSDSALASGSLALTVGLSNSTISSTETSTWWNSNSITTMEKACTRPKKGKSIQNLKERTSEIFDYIDTTIYPGEILTALVKQEELEGRGMKLRERKNVRNWSSEPVSPILKPNRKTKSSISSPVVVERVVVAPQTVPMIKFVFKSGGVE